MKVGEAYTSVEEVPRVERGNNLSDWTLWFYDEVCSQSVIREKLMACQGRNCLSLDSEMSKNPFVFCSDKTFYLQIITCCIDFITV